MDPSIGAELKITLYENLESGGDFVGYTLPLGGVKAFRRLKSLRVT